MNQYIIQYSGLSDGEHKFQYEIKQDFLQESNYAEINKGNIDVDVYLTKRPQMLVLRFKIKGTINIICDRCLDHFDLNINNDTLLYVKFGDEHKEETDNSIIIQKETGDFDLSHYIYEYIMLSLPYKRMHEDISECNQDVIHKLKPSKEQSIDPRLASLKNIYNTHN
ncbi:MAG: YceD family protein [Bacteroidota bacterium]